MYLSQTKSQKIKGQKTIKPPEAKYTWRYGKWTYKSLLTRNHQVYDRRPETSSKLKLG